MAVTPTKGLPPPSSVESPLFPQYETPAKNHPPPSDTESEVDEGMKNLDGMSKEELLKVYRKQERTMNKLKGKFTQLTLAYKEVEKEKDKIKVRKLKRNLKIFVYICILFTACVYA